MNFIDPARVLVFLRKRKKGALLFKRNACKGTAEKSKLGPFFQRFIFSNVLRCSSIVRLAPLTVTSPFLAVIRF